MTVVSLQRHAQAVRNRLWNPPNANHSTEKDVVSDSELRARRNRILQQQEEAKRAEEDYRRHLALDQLMRNAVADHQRVKLIAAKILVEEKVGEAPKIPTIVNFIAREYGVTAVDIMSRRRSKEVATPRAIVYYLARTITFKSLPEIGRILNGRDHTTILKTVNRVQQKINRNPVFKATIEHYQRILTGTGV